MAPHLNFELLGEKPSIPLRLTSLFVCLSFAYVLYSVIYNLFISPLRNIPGPKLWAISPLPQMLMQYSGTPHKQMLALHERYGDAVRVGPTAVSFTDSQAFKDLCGHRKAGVPENLKASGFYKDIDHGIIGANSEEHSRQRRILAHSFSAAEMVKQEALIRGYIDLLFDRLRDHAVAAKPVDVVKWFNYTTFDVIGDLVFGEPFDCLASSNYHDWVSMIFNSNKQKLLMGQLRRAYPTLESFVTPLIKMFAAKQLRYHEELTQTKVAKRLSLGSERPDFMDSMIAKDKDGNRKMTLQQLYHNADILIVGGSETTATTLCGVTQLLCSHPEVQRKLKDEVRSSFASEEEINLLNVQHLKYMTAVIDEGLRIYPAAPASVPRQMHRGGDNVCGKYLPEGTTVDIWYWVMFHHPRNFTQPEAFIPERWLGDPRFATDKKKAFNPFSTGGRSCIGKNLAYAEMRLIISKLLWNYDISLANEEDKDWVYRQKMWGLWDKPSLDIRLTPRKTG